MVSNLSGVQESKSTQQQPWLLISDGEKNCRIKTNVFNNKPQLLYDVGGEIPEFLGRDIMGYFGEWVLLGGSSDDILVNLLSKETIEVPFLEFSHNFCTLTSHPYDPTCRIVYFSTEKNALIFCQPGDKEFTIKKWDDELFPSRVGVVAGKLFLSLPPDSMDTFKVGILEFTESTYRFEVVEMDCKEIRWAFIENYFLFEYSGELFVVFQIGGRLYSENIIRFEIFKADFLNKKLVSVENLGRVAIFIGHETAHARCASVESGIAANSIYFLEHSDVKNCYIHNLKEGTFRLKPAFSSAEMEMKTGVYIQLVWIMLPSEASFRKLLKGGQERDSEKENKASVEVEEVGLQNSWNTVPQELLNLIQLHLFGKDHAVFRVVCKEWHQVSSIRDYGIPALLEMCQSSSPLFMFQEDLTISCDSAPIFRFLDPVHKKLYRTGIPELRGTDIHYSKDGWSLVSRRSDSSIFFFNPLTQEKIELPRIPSDSFFYKRPCSLSFSSLPTCSDCLVVGANYKRFYILKHGEETWRKQELGKFKGHYARYPVVINGLHHFMSDRNRDMVVFNLKDDGVEGQFPYFQSLSIKFAKFKCLHVDDFFLEIDGALAFVSVKPDEGQISIFKWSYLKKDWKLMGSGVDFRGKAMFLSRRGSFMDDVGGMGNTIFLPMIDDDAKEGVFYSLATRKYHTLYSGYSSELPSNVDKFLNGVWIKPDRKIIGDKNLKWFM